MSEPIGTKIAGKYTLERFVGEGGLGRVYLATQPPLGRKVAVKLLRPELCCDLSIRARFEREAYAASQVSHPNAVVIYDFGCETKGLFAQLYLVMEWLEGETLHDRIQEHPKRRLPTWEAVRILSQVLRPLGAFHRAGVIHRDLKPDNIMLCPSELGEQVKLLDFGIAKVSGPTLTATGQMVGTPHYMAPEQIMARKDITPAADLYTVGILLYEALTGDPPYLSENRMDLFRSHLKETPKPLVKVFPLEPFLAPLDAVIQKAMAKNPKDRYQSADEMRQAMEDALVASVAQQDEMAALPTGETTQVSRRLTPSWWQEAPSTPTLLLERAKETKEEKEGALGEEGTAPFVPLPQPQAKETPTLRSRSERPTEVTPKRTPPPTEPLQAMPTEKMPKLVGGTEEGFALPQRLPSDLPLPSHEPLSPSLEGAFSFMQAETISLPPLPLRPESTIGHPPEPVVGLERTRVLPCLSERRQSMPLLVVPPSFEPPTKEVAGNRSGSSQRKPKARAEEALAHSLQEVGYLPPKTLPTRPAKTLLVRQARPQKSPAPSWGFFSWVGFLLGWVGARIWGEAKSRPKLPR